jgi:AraC family transcriptional regulator
MSSDRPLIIDPTKLGDINRVLPTPTLIGSPENDRGILLMQYDRIPAHEVPEYHPLHHVVAVWGMQSKAKLETKFDDYYRWRGMFGRGAAGVIPAGMKHWAVWDRPITLTVIFLHPIFVQQIASDLTIGDRIELIPKHDTKDPSLTQLGLLLKADLEEGHLSGSLYRESLATAFTARLLNHHAVCQIKPPSTSGLSSQRLQILLDYIHESLTQEIRLADLAKLVHLSKYHLCHTFKHQMGMSLHQYVIQQRVERAKQLLKHRGMTIADIAQASGFSSNSHLTHHFKRLVGVTPQVARSQDRAN